MEILVMSLLCGMVYSSNSFSAFSFIKLIRLS